MDSFEKRNYIISASYYKRVLLIITNFEKWEIPVDFISHFSKKDNKDIENFEIDEDGSFIYWPNLDVHLGYNQFKEIDIKYRKNIDINKVKYLKDLLCECKDIIENDSADKWHSGLGVRINKAINE